MKHDLQDKLTEIEPLNGSLWKHYSGDYYRVIIKAIESNPPHRIMITYQSEKFGYVWCHPIDEWFKEIDGIKRFTLVHV